ncbi:membrane protein with HlyD domain [Leptothrix cholodnii SP-6]|uniref:Membrane protein with HlyD domain n=1 Tax=Leptothrix cholodnii (strain ATCC 51168 / LMG 8142 / SP-6) TaxID=395495 RepID=B1Y5U9_LEPCP|nr:HlyD family efflux transporter periplasmic adaptor subunit [Leptothrix cholodnii]ACB35995.1 membrane protein with HlyD domain [Leptothrix cholodnii SP-6]
MSTLTAPPGATFMLDAPRPPAAPAPWPALRDDLQLHHGPALPDGQPSWTLHDPVRHRFLRIDWLSHEVLRHWWLRDAALIAEQISQQTTLAVEPEQVKQVLTWAVREELVLPVAPPPAGRSSADNPLGAVATWLLHHYLFFRIPLFNPDRLLQRLLPWVSGLGSRRFGQLTLAALAFGLIGLARHAEQLQAQWLDLLSWRGLALYGLTLTLVKVAHEFGHALVAKHHGLRVPTMGAAFMVMWPVAYTDTSEAWRLADPRARLQIAAAGVRTELTLAAWATLAWVLLPDGGLRTAAFIVATMTWVSTLLINTSPFMRFDGYFLLCDLLDMPNLHERSFALARWQLRRSVLGWQAEAPEALTPGWQRALIAFAWATWAYRLVLYLGIAWMVYHFGFPALGLLLFAVEMGWFIAAPIQRELGLWRQGWPRWRGAVRWIWSLLGLLLIGSLAALPWPVRETAGAVLRPAQELALRMPATATLRALPLQPGQRIAAGTPLLMAEVPMLQRKLDSSAVRIRQLGQQVASASLSGDQQAQWQSLQADLATARGEAAALRQELVRYRPVAPFDALVVEVDPSLRAGMVVGPQQTLMRLASAGPGRVLAYVSESAASRLKAGDRATFGADANPLARWDAHIVNVAPHASATLAEPMLARSHGGPIEAREQSGRWLPLQPLYRVELQLDADPGLSPRHWRGHVVIELPGRSLWERGWTAAAEVLAREVGF